jgi:hypothetical protein
MTTSLGTSNSMIASLVQYLLPKSGTRQAAVCLPGASGTNSLPHPIFAGRKPSNVTVGVASQIMDGTTRWSTKSTPVLGIGRAVMLESLSYKLLRRDGARTNAYSGIARTGLSACFRVGRVGVGCPGIDGTRSVLPLRSVSDWVGWDSEAVTLGEADVGVRVLGHPPLGVMHCPTPRSRLTCGFDV